MSMNNNIPKKHTSAHKLWFKTVAIGLIIAFLCNQLSYAIEPSPSYKSSYTLLPESSFPSGDNVGPTSMLYVNRIITRVLNETGSLISARGLKTLISRHIAHLKDTANIMVEKKDDAFYLTFVQQEDGKKHKLKYSLAGDVPGEVVIEDVDDGTKTYLSQTEEINPDLNYYQMHEVEIPSKWTKKEWKKTHHEIKQFIDKHVHLWGDREGSIESTLTELALNIMEEGKGGTIKVYAGTDSSFDVSGIQIVAEDRGEGLPFEPNEWGRVSAEHKQKEGRGAGFRNIAIAPDRVTIEYKGEKWVRDDLKMFDNAGKSDVTTGTRFTLGFNIIPISIIDKFMERHEKKTEETSSPEEELFAAAASIQPSQGEALEIEWKKDITPSEVVSFTDYLKNQDSIEEDMKRYYLRVLLFSIIASTLHLTDYALLKPLGDLLCIDESESHMRGHTEEFVGQAPLLFPGRSLPRAVIDLAREITEALEKESKDPNFRDMIQEFRGRFRYFFTSSEDTVAGTKDAFGFALPGIMLAETALWENYIYHTMIWAVGGGIALAAIWHLYKYMCEQHLIRKNKEERDKEKDLEKAGRATIKVLRMDVDKKYMVSLPIVEAKKLNRKNRTKIVRSLKGWGQHKGVPGVLYRDAVKLFIKELRKADSQKLEDLYFVLSGSEVEGWVLLSHDDKIIKSMEIAPWNKSSPERTRKYQGIKSEIRNFAKEKAVGSKDNEGLGIDKERLKEEVADQRYRRDQYVAEYSFNTPPAMVKRVREWAKKILELVNKLEYLFNWLLSAPPGKEEELLKKAQQAYQAAWDQADTIKNIDIEVDEKGAIVHDVATPLQMFSLFLLEAHTENAKNLFNDFVRIKPILEKLSKIERIVFNKLTSRGIGNLTLNWEASMSSGDSSPEEERGMDAGELHCDSLASIRKNIISCIFSSLGIREEDYNGLKWQDKRDGFAAAKISLRNLNKSALREVFNIPTNERLRGSVIVVNYGKETWPVLLCLKRRAAPTRVVNLSEYYRPFLDHETIRFIHGRASEIVGKNTERTPFTFIYIYAMFGKNGNLVDLRDAKPSEEEIEEEGLLVLKIPVLPGVYGSPYGSSKLSAEITAEYAEPGKEVLVIGTGPGIEGIIAAKKGAKVTASDVKEMVVANTKLSANIAGVEIEVLRRDLLEGLGVYDFVIFNMPHYKKETQNSKPAAPFEANIKDVEGKLLKQVLNNIEAHLKEKGVAVIINDKSLETIKFIEEIIKENGTLTFDLVKTGENAQAYIIQRKTDKLEAKTRIQAQLEKNMKERYLRDLVGGIPKPVIIPGPKRADTEESKETAESKEAVERIKKFIEAIGKGKYQRGKKVDLRGLPEDKEIILIGDLHERLDNFGKILRHRKLTVIGDEEVLGPSVREKVKKGEAVLIILGDAVHSDENVNSRISRSMERSIDMMEQIMQLKIDNPDHVYYILGNHDDPDSNCGKEYIEIKEDGESKEGAVNQARIYREKLIKMFGMNYLNLYRKFIDVSPIRLLADGLIAAHAGPPKDLSLDEIKTLSQKDLKKDFDEETFKSSMFLWGRHESILKKETSSGKMDDLTKKSVYSSADIERYKREVRQPDAVFIVAHTPHLIPRGRFYSEPEEKYFIIYGAGTFTGYASYRSGKLDFFEVRKEVPVSKIKEASITRFSKRDAGIEWAAEVDPYQIKRHVEMLAEKGFFFNAQVEGDKITVGYIKEDPDDKSISHASIIKPSDESPYTLKGWVENPGELSIALSSVSMELIKLPDQWMKLYNGYVRLARFLIENGFPGDFKLTELTKDCLGVLARRAGVKDAPQTLAGLAALSIISEDRTSGKEKTEKPPKKDKKDKGPEALTYLALIGGIGLAVTSVLSRVLGVNLASALSVCLGSSGTTSQLAGIVMMGVSLGMILESGGKAGARTSSDEMLVEVYRIFGDERWEISGLRTRSGFAASTTIRTNQKHVAGWTKKGWIKPLKDFGYRLTKRGFKAAKKLYKEENTLEKFTTIKNPAIGIHQLPSGLISGLVRHIEAQFRVSIYIEPERVGESRSVLANWAKGLADLEIEHGEKVKVGIRDHAGYKKKTLNSILSLISRLLRDSDTLEGKTDIEEYYFKVNELLAENDPIRKLKLISEQIKRLEDEYEDNSKNISEEAYRLKEVLEELIRKISEKDEALYDELNRQKDNISDLIADIEENPKMSSDKDRTGSVFTKYLPIIFGAAVIATAVIAGVFRGEISGFAPLLIMLPFMIGMTSYSPSNEEKFSQDRARKTIRQMFSEDEYMRKAAARDLRRMPIPENNIMNRQFIPAVVETLGRKILEENDSDMVRAAAIYYMGELHKAFDFFPDDVSIYVILEILNRDSTSLDLRKESLRLLTSVKRLSPELAIDIFQMVLGHLYEIDDDKLQALGMELLGRLGRIPFPAEYHEEGIIKRIARTLEVAAETGTVELTVVTPFEAALCTINLSRKAQIMAIRQIVERFEQSVRFLSLVIAKSNEIAIYPPDQGERVIDSGYMFEEISAAGETDLDEAWEDALYNFEQSYRIFVEILSNGYDDSEGLLRETSHALRSITFIWEPFLERYEKQPYLSGMCWSSLDRLRRMLIRMIYTPFYAKGTSWRIAQNKTVNLDLAEILAKFSFPEIPVAKNVVIPIIPLIFDGDDNVAKKAQWVFSSIWEKDPTIKSDPNMTKLSQLTDAWERKGRTDTRSSSGYTLVGELTLLSGIFLSGINILVTAGLAILGAVILTVLIVRKKKSTKEKVITLDLRDRERIPRTRKETRKAWEEILDAFISGKRVKVKVTGITQYAANGKLSGFNVSYRGVVGFVHKKDTNLDFTQGKEYLEYFLGTYFDLPVVDPGDQASQVQPKFSMKPGSIQAVPGEDKKEKESSKKARGRIRHTPNKQRKKSRFNRLSKLGKKLEQEKIDSRQLEELDRAENIIVGPLEIIENDEIGRIKRAKDYFGNVWEEYFYMSAQHVIKLRNITTGDNDIEVIMVPGDFNLKKCKVKVNGEDVGYFYYDDQKYAVYSATFKYRNRGIGQTVINWVAKRAQRANSGVSVRTMTSPRLRMLAQGLMAESSLRGEIDLKNVEYIVKHTEKENPLKTRKLGRIKIKDGKIASHDLPERFLPVLRGEVPEIIDRKTISTIGAVLMYSGNDTEDIEGLPNPIYAVLMPGGEVERTVEVEQIYDSKKHVPSLGRPFDDLAIEDNVVVRPSLKPVKTFSLAEKEDSFPDGSPYNIYRRLCIMMGRKHRKTEGISAETIRMETKGRMPDGHLSIETVKRDLGVLVRKGLVEKTGKGKEAIYRAADLSPPEQMIVESLLEKLGSRPTREEQEAVKREFSEFSEFRQTRKRLIEYYRENVGNPLNYINYALVPLFNKIKDIETLRIVSYLINKYVNKKNKDPYGYVAFVLPVMLEKSESATSLGRWMRVIDAVSDARQDTSSMFQIEGFIRQAKDPDSLRDILLRKGYIDLDKTGLGLTPVGKTKEMAEKVYSEVGPYLYEVEILLKKIYSQEVEPEEARIIAGEIISTIDSVIKRLASEQEEARKKAAAESETFRLFNSAFWHTFDHNIRNGVGPTRTYMYLFRDYGDDTYLGARESSTKGINRAITVLQHIGDGPEVRFNKKDNFIYVPGFDNEHNRIENFPYVIDSFSKQPRLELVQDEKAIRILTSFGSFGHNTNMTTSTVTLPLAEEKSDGEVPMSLEEAHSLVAQHISYDGDGVKETVLLAEEILKNPVDRVMVVGAGLPRLPLLLALTGKEVVFVDAESDIISTFQREANFLKEGMNIKYICGEIGSLNLEKEGLEAHSFDAITFVDLAGGRTTQGRPIDWMEEASELLKPEGYLVIDEDAESKDPMKRHFEVVFPGHEVLSGGRHFWGGYGRGASRNRLYRVKNNVSEETFRRDEIETLIQQIYPDAPDQHIKGIARIVREKDITDIVEIKNLCKEWQGKTGAIVIREEYKTFEEQIIELRKKDFLKKALITAKNKVREAKEEGRISKEEKRSILSSIRALRKKDAVFIYSVSGRKLSRDDFHVSLTDNGKFGVLKDLLNENWFIRNGPGLVADIILFKLSVEDSGLAERIISEERSLYAKKAIRTYLENYRKPLKERWPALLPVSEALEKDRTRIVQILKKVLDALFSPDSPAYFQVLKQMSTLGVFKLNQNEEASLFTWTAGKYREGCNEIFLEARFSDKTLIHELGHFISNALGIKDPHKVMGNLVGVLFYKKSDTEIKRAREIEEAYLNGDLSESYMDLGKAILFEITPPEIEAGKELGKAYLNGDLSEMELKLEIVKKWMSGNTKKYVDKPNTNEKQTDDYAAGHFLGGLLYFLNGYDKRKTMEFAIELTGSDWFKRTLKFYKAPGFLMDVVMVAGILLTAGTTCAAGWLTYAITESVWSVVGVVSGITVSGGLIVGWIADRMEKRKKERIEQGDISDFGPPLDLPTEDEGISGIVREHEKPRRDEIETLIQQIYPNAPDQHVEGIARIVREKGITDIEEIKNLCKEWQGKTGAIRIRKDDDDNAKEPQGYRPVILQNIQGDVTFQKDGKKIVFPRDLLLQLKDAVALARRLEVELNYTFREENGVIVSIECPTKEEEIAVVTTGLDDSTRLNNPDYHIYTSALLAAVVHSIRNLAITPPDQLEQKDISRALSALANLQKRMQEYRTTVRIYSPKHGHISLDEAGVGDLLNGINRCETVEQLLTLFQEYHSLFFKELKYCATEWIGCSELADYVSKYDRGLEVKQKPIDTTSNLISAHNHPNGMPTPPSAIRGSAGREIGDVFMPGFFDGGVSGLILDTSTGDELFLLYEQDDSGKEAYFNMFSKFWRERRDIVPDLRAVAMKAGLDRDDNVTCGTICESEHREGVDAINRQLASFYEELAKELSTDENPVTTPLKSDQVIQALEAKGYDQNMLMDIRAYIWEEMPEIKKKQIQIFFAIPPNGQTLWRVEDKYAGGHFGRRSIHISLPLILAQADPKEAALAIVIHDYNHIDRKGHIEDESMRMVREAAGSSTDLFPEGELAQDGEEGTTARKESELEEDLRANTGEEISKIEIDGYMMVTRAADALKAGKIIALDLSRLRGQRFSYGKVRERLSVVAQLLAEMFAEIYRDGRDNQGPFYIHAILRNSFAHGNKLDFDLPIYIRVKRNDEGAATGLEFYDLASDREPDDGAKKSAMVTELYGMHRDEGILNIRKYSREHVLGDNGKVLGTCVTLDSDRKDDKQHSNGERDVRNLLGANKWNISRGFTEYIKIMQTAEMGKELDRSLLDAEVYVDVGCGIGRAGVEIADFSEKAGYPVKVYGIDMVAWGEEDVKNMQIPKDEDFSLKEFSELKAHHEEKGTYSFIQGDITNVKIPERADVATAFFVLQYVEDPIKALLNIYNQMNVDGRIFATVTVPRGTQTIKDYTIFLDELRQKYGAFTPRMMEMPVNSDNARVFMIIIEKTRDEKASTDLELISSEKKTVNIKGESFDVRSPAYVYRYKRREPHGDNVTCGTICESEHREGIDAINKQLASFYEKLAKELSTDENPVATPLKSDQVIQALEAKGYDQNMLMDIRAYIWEEMPEIKKKQIQIFFAIPPNGQTLWRVEDKYAGGHFGRRSIHISLPLILAQADPKEAALAIVIHDYNHINGKGHIEDEGMRIVKSAADGEHKDPLDGRSDGAPDPGSGSRVSGLDIMETDQKIAKLFDQLRDSCIKKMSDKTTESLRSIKQLIPALERQVEMVSAISNQAELFAKKTASVLVNIKNLIIFIEQHDSGIAAMPQETKELAQEVVGSIKGLTNRLDSIEQLESEKYLCSEELIEALKDAKNSQRAPIIKEWLADRVHNYIFDGGKEISRFFNHSGPGRKKSIVSILMDLAVEDSITANHNNCNCGLHYDYVDMIRELPLSEDLPQSTEMKVDIWIDKIRNEKYSERAMAECLSFERERRDVEIYLLASIIVSDRGLEPYYPGVIDMLVARQNKEEPFRERLNIKRHYGKNLYEKMVRASGNREHEKMFDLGWIEGRVLDEDAEKTSILLEGKLELHGHAGGFYFIFLNVNGEGDEYIELGHLVLELPENEEGEAKFDLLILDGFKGYGLGIRRQGLGRKVFNWMMGKLKGQAPSVHFILPTEDLLISVEKYLKGTEDVALEACLENDTWQGNLKAHEISALLKKGASIGVRLSFDRDLSPEEKLRRDEENWELGGMERTAWPEDEEGKMIEGKPLIVECIELEKQRVEENLGIEWIGPVKTVMQAPEGDKEIKLSIDDHGGLTMVKDAVYNGEKYVAKYVIDKRDEDHTIVAQAEIYSYLDELDIQGIPRVKHLLELDTGEKVILFERFPPGWDLRTKLKEDGSLSEEEAVSIILKVSEIVKELQEAGVYHWDIKPSNIWITNEKEIILFDLDFAFRSKEDFLERKRFISRTAPYTSETRWKWVETGSFDEETEVFPPVREEVFSLAMTLLHMIIWGDEKEKGQGPPKDYAGTQLAFLDRRSEVTKELKDVLHNAISEGESDYKDVDEFMEALNNRPNADEVQKKKTEEELSDSQEFVDALINWIEARALETGKRGEKLIIGIDTSWIPEVQLDLSSMRMLLKRIKNLSKSKLKGFKNIEVVIEDNPQVLADLIQRARRGKDSEEALAPLSNIIILGEEDILGSSTFGKFRASQEDEGACLAKIRLPDNFSDFSGKLDINIVKIVTEMLERASLPGAPRVFYIELPDMIIYESLHDLSNVYAKREEAMIRA